MQRYQPLPGGPPPDLSRLFDERADEHLDALVRVVFPQNMKNVERYYRWLCFEYARQLGRIHIGLVDTLFRYNHRHMRGAFLQQLREMGLVERLFGDGPGARQLHALADLHAVAHARREAGRGGPQQARPTLRLEAAGALPARSGEVVGRGLCLALAGEEGESGSRARLR